MAKNVKSLSIVYPAYNEQGNIEETILKSLEFAQKNSKDFEIIIVDDGSRDNTFKIANSIAKRNGHVKVLKNTKNLGYGATVWKGLRFAKKDLIFFSDSDQQFDINELKQFIPKTTRYDVVIGHRRKRQDPLMRKLNMWGWKIVIRLMLGLRTKDVDCAFKLFRREVIEKITIKSQGATFSAELIFKIKNMGYKILELPVSHYPRRAGSPTGAKVSVIKKAFVEIWRVYKTNKKSKRTSKPRNSRS